MINRKTSVKGASIDYKLNGMHFITQPYIITHSKDSKLNVVPGMHVVHA